jgi:hypothetical protein
VDVEERGEEEKSGAFESREGSPEIVDDEDIGGDAQQAVTAH